MTERLDVPSRRARQVRVVAVLTIVAAAMVASGLWAWNHYLRGVPLWDEWYCSDGEAPASDTEFGSSACFAEGEMLPEGWSVVE